MWSYMTHNYHAIMEQTKYMTKALILMDKILLKLQDYFIQSFVTCAKQNVYMP